MMNAEKIARSVRGKGGTIVVGPLVWQPTDGLKSKRWYFTVAAGEMDKKFSFIQIVTSGKDDRAAFMANLLALRPPCVAIDTDDELIMARYVETIWPSKRSTELREKVELERAAS